MNKYYLILQDEGWRYQGYAGNTESNALIAQDSLNWRYAPTKYPSIEAAEEHITLLAEEGVRGDFYIVCVEKIITINNIINYQTSVNELTPDPKGYMEKYKVTITMWEQNEPIIFEHVLANSDTDAERRVMKSLPTEDAVSVLTIKAEHEN